MGTNYNLEQPAAPSSPTVPSASTNASEEKSKSSYGLLIVAIIFLIAVVGVLLYLLYSSAQKATDANVTPTTGANVPTATPDPRYDGWLAYSKATSIQSYSFRYPADWVLTEEATSETDIEVVATSPDSSDYAFQLTFINGPADSTACLFPDTDATEAEQIKQYPLIGYYMLEEFADIERDGVLFARRGFHTNLSENAPEPIYLICVVDPVTKSGYVATPYRYKLPTSGELDEEIMQTLDLILLSFTENRVR